MSFARLALALIPFAPLMGLLARPGRRPEVRGEARAKARAQVRNVLLAIRQRVPGQTTCLHRAIAAQMMLRRRGVSTTLYYGARSTPAKGLTLHAWVQDGDVGVVGLKTAQREQYQIIARYPEHRGDNTFNAHLSPGGRYEQT